MDSDRLIEEARAALDNKLKGYQHPDKLVSSSAYRTEKTAYLEKNEESHQDNVYATFNAEKYEKLKLCPSCREKAMYACDCERNDRMCKNGHMWYINPNNEIVLGDPHENEE